MEPKVTAAAKTSNEQANPGEASPIIAAAAAYARNHGGTLDLAGAQALIAKAKTPADFTDLLSLTTIYGKRIDSDTRSKLIQGATSGPPPAGVADQSNDPIFRQKPLTVTYQPKSGERPMAERFHLYATDSADIMGTVPLAFAEKMMKGTGYKPVEVASPTGGVRLASFHVMVGNQKHTSLNESVPGERAGKGYQEVTYGFDVLPESAVQAAPAASAAQAAQVQAKDAAGNPVAVESVFSRVYPNSTRAIELGRQIFGIDKHAADFHDTKLSMSATGADLHLNVTAEGQTILKGDLKLSGGPALPPGLPELDFVVHTRLSDKDALHTAQLAVANPAPLFAPVTADSGKISLDDPWLKAQGATFTAQGALLWNNAEMVLSRDEGTATPAAPAKK